ncbi:nuclear transport factor 2 family protein [Streptomyces sp. 8K308]|uniref:YybH family protein n=1 Tax=Streptomyces sp. 8K308 TaxID=2530388 RepID=UPI001FB6649A|nr:nuclear transport factor 2 family protein [Streptomyces sp. 8K308]
MAPTLPAAPDEVPAAFAARFNSGDRDAVLDLYAADAVFVPRSGPVARGRAEIERANDKFLGLGEPITVRPRSVSVAGDVALLVVDWEIPAAGIRATATDVARRGADGRWRYVIDSPFGGS